MASVGATVIAVLAFNTTTTAWAAGPEIVAGPAADQKCYVPWSDKTKYFKFAPKPGPYRVALANGFIARCWR